MIVFFSILFYMRNDISFDFVLKQCHVDHTCSEIHEVSAEIIKGKIMDVSGSGSRVLNDSGQKHANQQVQQSMAGERKGSNVRQPKAEAGSGLNIEGDLRGALARVRHGQTNWTLFTHHDNGSLAFTAEGEGGVSELKSHLRNDIVAYGLVRKIDKIDDSETVKFAFVTWTGESIPRMFKARLGTTRGAVVDLFTPFHVELQTELDHELSDQIVQDLIGTHSGTKTKVLEDVRDAAYYHN